MRRRGNYVVLWVANEKSEFGKIKNTWRVDGVLTDRPSKLREWTELYNSFGKRDLSKVEYSERDNELLIITV